MKALPEFLQSGADQNLLSWDCQLAAAQQFCVSPAEVEGVALSLGLMPARYQRNQQIITVQDQRKLFRSRVAVIGCGGLGGYVIEELARLGVGTLVAVDPDIFKEHNLNRQLLSTVDALGRAKVELAAERVAEINPATILAADAGALCAGVRGGVAGRRTGCGGCTGFDHDPACAGEKLHRDADSPGSRSHRRLVRPRLDAASRRPQHRRPVW